MPPESVAGVSPAIGRMNSNSRLLYSGSAGEIYIYWLWDTAISFPRFICTVRKVVFV
jgi:hypothetical protein